MKLLILAFSWHLCAQVIGKDVSNYCMDAKNHKKAPGPESKLHGWCSPWQNRSCCTTDTTFDIDRMRSYDFTFDHCSDHAKMSQACQKHFKRDLCFYECEPNLGPWVVSVNMKRRKERFYKVPLCASECNQWFEDCQNDFTCAKNWIKDFKWNRTNHCTGKCITFKEMYGNASDFCESVWDGSYEYTTEDKPCMKIWFDPTKGNPNDAVFLSKIQSAGPDSMNFLGLSTVIFILMIAIVLGLFVGFVKMRDRFRRGSLLC